MEGINGVYVHILCGNGLSSTIIRAKNILFLVLKPKIHKLATVKGPKNYFRLSDLHKILIPGILDYFQPNKTINPFHPLKTPKNIKKHKKSVEVLNICQTHININLIFGMDSHEKCIHSKKLFHVPNLIFLP